MRTSRRSSALLVLFALISSAFPQQSAKGKAAENATSALLQMNKAYLQTPAAQKTQLLPRFRNMAAQRQQLLSSLIQTNPADVLRIAIPDDIRRNMPVSVQSYVEQTVQAQGVLEVLIEDSDSGSKMQYGLTTAAGRIALHFTDKNPTNLLTGSVVGAQGVQVGADLALACCTSSTTTSTSSLTTLSAALPNTFGEQKTLVILVNFQDNTSQPYTVSAAQNVMTQVSNWDLENSFQQTWLVSDVAGWFTIPLSSTTCNTSSIASYAQSAASAAGYNLSGYARFVVAFPQTSACNFWGLGTIGGSPSQAWVNGSFQLKVVSHEMGHNFGLYHSHSLNCGPAVVCTSGTVNEYGNWTDTMGNPYPGHFNAFQKERIGWLNDGAQPPIATVTASGTYQIGPYEAQDGAAKALKILESAASNSYYYLEFRQPTGADSFLSSQSNTVISGITFNLGSPSNGNSNDLLDMTPGDSNITNVALVVGQNYTDSTAGVTITPMTVSSTGATVQVSFGQTVCTSTNPTVSVSPLQSAYVTSGIPVNYTLTVKDNDSSGCAPVTFNLADAIPSGWTAGWSTSALSLSPGGSASATLTVTSPAGSADGFYNVDVSATNASATTYAASVTATYVISTPAPVSVSIKTNQSTYQPGQTVQVSVTVLTGTSAYAGATVTASITTPNGKTANLSGTTGGDGVASLSYKLSKRALAGTYGASAKTASTGTSATPGASTTFIVQ
jgi:NPCBM-associated, NEW3 domain of alpha-galactosidase